MQDAKLIHLQTVLCVCVAFEVKQWKVVNDWKRRRTCFGCLCILHPSNCVNKRLSSQICSQNLLHSNQKGKTDLKQIKRTTSETGTSPHKHLYRCLHHSAQLLYCRISADRAVDGMQMTAQQQWMGHLERVTTFKVENCLKLADFGQGVCS